MSTNSLGTSGKLWESSVASPVIHYGIYEGPSITMRQTTQNATHDMKDPCWSGGRLCNEEKGFSIPLLRIGLFIRLLWL